MQRLRRVTVVLLLLPRVGPAGQRQPPSQSHSHRPMFRLLTRPIWLLHRRRRGPAVRRRVPSRVLSPPTSSPEKDMVAVANANRSIRRAVTCEHAALIRHRQVVTYVHVRARSVPSSPARQQRPRR